MLKKVKKEWHPLDIENYPCVQGLSERIVNECKEIKKRVKKLTPQDKQDAAWLAQEIGDFNRTVFMTGIGHCHLREAFRIYGVSMEGMVDDRVDKN